MKRFEIPEINISMFDAEEIFTESAVGKAMSALQNDGATAKAVEWDDMPTSFVF